MLNKIFRLYGGGHSRGQVAVFYALLIPIILFMGGVGVDLGWYYLNVSRLQNAADAACLAGVQKFLSGGDESLYSDYKDSVLIDSVPSHILKDPITGEAHIANRDTSDGDTAAKSYVKKNISLDSATWNGDKIADAYTKADTAFKSVLWGYDEEDKNTLYYQVILEETIGHFFMPGWFAPMTARVAAVSKLTRYYLPKSVTTYEHEKGPNLFEQIKAVELAETYDSWDTIRDKYIAIYQAEHPGATLAEARTNYGRPMADARSVLSDGNHTVSGKKYRTETLTLTGNNTNQSNKDDIFIDWQSDISTYVTTNGDVASTSGGWNKNATTASLSQRIYGLINYDKPHEVRADKGQPDPLYAMIESEPMNVGIGTYATSSVHQIIININADNTIYTLQENGTDSDSNKVYKKVYTYRPMLFFYEGPEDLNGNTGGERASLPVILNLNADFRGVLFAPNSPVVINGNGHSFEGMVIAKSFVQLATSGTNKNADITGITFYTDNYGNIQYQKNSDGSYKTIQPTISPTTDPALILTDDEFVAGVTVQQKYFFLFNEDGSDKVKFYDKAKFNLSKSVFDAFDQALMTEYGYLNTPENLTIRTDSNGNPIKNVDYRSINNLFTVEDATRSD